MSRLWTSLVGLDYVLPRLCCISWWTIASLEVSWTQDRYKTDNDCKNTSLICIVVCMLNDQFWWNNVLISNMSLSLKHILFISEFVYFSRVDFSVQQKLSFEYWMINLALVEAEICDVFHQEEDEKLICCHLDGDILCNISNLSNYIGIIAQGENRKSITK